MAKENNRSTNNSAALATLAPEMGNVPPQAIELEESVLGALMLEADQLPVVQEYLSEDAFYKEEHRLIYRVINQLSSEREPIDLYTVTSRLKTNRELTKVGGASYLAQLTQRVGSAANIEFYARIVTQKYIQRELIRASTEIQRRSYDGANDITDLIGYAESEILKITEGHVKRSVQSAADILRRSIEQIEKASENDSRYNGVCTGFTELDNTTLGWQPSDLIIVAARPSMGKTAFVLTMARNMAVEYEAPVAFFSLEMASTQLMNRLIVGETGLDHKLIRSGKLSPDEWKILETKTKPLGMAPLYIDDTPALSIYEFRSKARRLHSNYGIKLIIIDYLQLMTASGQGDKGNREQEVSFISRTLKGIAKELNIPIIALSQLNRAAESRTGSKRPQLSDLRESGAIEQDADVVALIHRPEYYGFTQTDTGESTAGLTEIILAKHRNGEVRDIKLRFVKDQAKFVNWDQSPIQPATQQGDFDMVESQTFQSSTASPLQSATSNEFDIQQVNVAPQDEAPF
ncbi:MAG: replicative DNA helicase [Alistipes sp.]|nr:replicative DNA helicase [Alistipes sp.]MBQ5836456.1 replicative DNA helicase [Alistipes sp.]